MKVFAFGSNGSGQLAIGHKEDVTTPTKCLFAPPTPTDNLNFKITNIVAGGNHTLLLTESGHVYATGYNEDNRCGPTITHPQRPRAQDPEESQSDSPTIEDARFRRVVLTHHGDVIDTFKYISATWEGSLLVPSTQDKVFVLGSTLKGELGLGRDFANGQTQTQAQPGATIPNFPPKDTKVISLASGMSHTIAILSNGDVYGWGGSRKGQLGDSLKAEKIVWAPAKLQGLPFCATGAVCGREFTVVLGRRELGEFVVLADAGNRWGVVDVPGSLRSEGGANRWKEFFDIGASWHGIYVHASVDSATGPNSHNAYAHAHAATAPGSLIAWGRNDRGQLPPPNLPPLLEIGVGSEHVLALLEDGSVATFGWGEHGNCGPDTDARGNVAGTYNLVSLPGDVSAGRVIGVAAGCATSWLIVE